MTPEEYTAQVERAIAQDCPLCDQIQTKWTPDTDRLGFTLETAVLLRGGGSIILHENLRHRKERPCRPIGDGLYIVRPGIR